MKCQRLRSHSAGARSWTPACCKPLLALQLPRRHLSQHLWFPRSLRSRLGSWGILLPMCPSSCTRNFISNWCQRLKSHAAGARSWIPACYRLLALQLPRRHLSQHLWFPRSLHSRLGSWGILLPMCPSSCTCHLSLAARHAPRYSHNANSVLVFTEVVQAKHQVSPLL